MTAADAFYGEPQAFDGTVFYQCLFSILRACGGEAARGRGEGADASLIEYDECQQWGGQDFSHVSAILFNRLRILAAMT